MLRPRFPPKGHSLLDLLLVLALGSILLASALPNLTQAHRRYAAYAAARQLRADLAGARVEAVLRGSTVTVEIDTIAGAYEARDGAGVSIFARRIPESVRIRTSAYRQSIPFTARGTTDLYSTTWIGPSDDPDAPWHGLRVAPSGALYRP